MLDELGVSPEPATEALERAIALGTKESETPALRVV
jgi:hypothetical protein